jgi:NO-binding membrane sensor protein with MHYT domain
MLALGTAIHYIGKAIMLAAAWWLPWPEAVVVVGWVITTTALTVTLNAARKIKDGGE